MSQLWRKCDCVKTQWAATCGGAGGQGAVSPQLEMWVSSPLTWAEKNRDGVKWRETGVGEGEEES